MLEIPRKIWRALTSLKLTIVCLVVLMVLVVACTLAQVELGTFGAVKLYIRSVFVWWQVPGYDVSLPVFPGGGLVGLVLGLNLLAAQFQRLEVSWKKAGLWVVHAGLILLFVGEFLTAMTQRDMQMSIEEGQTLNFLEVPREVELAIIDTTDPKSDHNYLIPQSLLSNGALIEVPDTPLQVRVVRFFQNASVGRRAPEMAAAATMGIGAQIAIEELPPASRDDARDMSAAIIEPMAGGHSYGKWLVSLGLGAPQSFMHEGHTYVLKMRPRRQYLPYTVTLKEFSHDVYPGTRIPKNFSSLVHLSNPVQDEERDVLIYMNQPLRYDGKAFYQASFGKNDTLSVLQVVENPSWLLPYIACVLVGLGLLLHFGLTLRRSMARRQRAARRA